MTDKAAVAHVRAERADTDKVIGCGSGTTGIEAQGNVIVAGAVRERIIADSRVAAAGGVTNESLKTNRRVSATIGVVHECVVTKCAVGEAIAGGVGKSLKADSRAKTDLLKPPRAGRKTLKCLITHGSVGAGYSVAFKGLLPDSHIRTDVHSLNICQRAASCIVEKRPGARGCIAAGSVE